MDRTKSDTGATNDSNIPPILTITTVPRRITIRPYRRTDMPAVTYEVNNIKVVANLTDRVPHPYTLEDARWWVDNCLDESNWKHSSVLGRKIPVKYVIAMAAVNDCKEGEHEDIAIGAIGLDFQSDVWRRSAEFGYWLGEEHWGGGVMSAVVREFVPWVWRTFGEEELVRLKADVFGWNPASVKVLQKAGFEIEGRQRLAVYKNGRLGDAVGLGLVRPGLLLEEGVHLEGQEGEQTVIASEESIA